MYRNAKFTRPEISYNLFIRSLRPCPRGRGDVQGDGEGERGSEGQQKQTRDTTKGEEEWRGRSSLE